MLLTAGQMDQAMLGMPSREYYLTETDIEYKTAYLRYMINVAKLFGAEEAVAIRDMRDVLQFEELFANVSFATFACFMFFLPTTILLARLHIV